MTAALGWMHDATKSFLKTLDRLSDYELALPSALPGWSRSHVVAHVHYNALALRRLCLWAATGEEHPMYTSAEERAREIESGSQFTPVTLRALAHESAAALADDLNGLGDGWAREVVTAQGRRVPATEIPWLRTREMAVHAVDLGAGTSFADVPDVVVEALLVDVVRRRSAAGEGAVLAAWLTGRTPDAPQLGHWL